MNTQIMTRKYGLGDILSEGWRVFVSRYKIIIPIFLCVFLPLYILMAFFPVTMFIDNFGETQGTQVYQNIRNILNGIIGLIAYAGVAFVVEKYLHGEEITWKKGLELGFSRWGASLWTSILGGLIIIGLTFLLIVPGIIWTVYYTFMLYVVALRGISGKRALDYSKKLVKGQWWRVFGIQFVLGLIGAVAGFIIGLPMFFVAGISPFLVIFFDILLCIVTSILVVFPIIFFLNNDYLKNPPAAPEGTQVIEPGQETVLS